jgi:hypothetical protein
VNIAHIKEYVPFWQNKNVSAVWMNFIHAIRPTTREMLLGPCGRGIESYSILIHLMVLGSQFERESSQHSFHVMLLIEHDVKQSELSITFCKVKN